MSDLDATGQDELLDGLLGDFLDESDQLLRQLTDNLLQLDGWVRSLENDHHQHCDEQLLNEMFRSAHSLKGLSAMLGLDDINNLTHKIENVFDAARKRELTVGSDVVELMFMGVDQLVALIDVLKDPSADPVESDAVLDGIHQLLESAGAARERTSQADAERLLADAPEPSDGEPPPAAEQDRSTEQGCSAELT
ncbi:MAG TPA: Hpt domain-containing protein, partial [Candidatus Paceibacterota bacterium]|nr:Hpt domain-containing protein [Candidatus Paceibacterota bacterium]